MTNSAPSAENVRSLRDLSLKIRYRTDSDDLVNDFYVPCLERSVSYNRAAGYFSSAGLSIAAQGVATLIASGGRMKLVVSPILSVEDIEAMRQGYRERGQVLDEAARREVEDVATQLERDRLAALSWLIANRRLDVKLAFRVSDNGIPLPGIYHEKLGVATDVDGNFVAFSGSSNESAGGLVENFERLDVFWSWDDREKRAETAHHDFERLWAGETPHLQVLDFTSCADKVLRPYLSKTPPDVDPGQRAGSAAKRGAFQVPSHVTLRDYQTELIRAWQKSGYRGIIALATGCGKTITALAALKHLGEREQPPMVIVVCPYRHLVTQWNREAGQFGVEPIIAMESRDTWHARLADELFALRRSPKPVFLLTTSATFASASMQNLVPSVPADSVLVVDEVHNVGAERLRTVLPQHITRRLGLSATPERAYDDEGTAAIFDYFGEILTPAIGIPEAIDRGLLSPYHYHPIVVSLEDDEQAEYRELSRQLATLWEEGTPLREVPGATVLLSRRARLIAGARNKLPALERLVSDGALEGPSLVYCGDGTVDASSISEFEQRQIDAVTKLLGYHLGIPVAQYTHETSTRDRESLQRQLASGSLQALVAIRCLDEGVDIPEIRTAVILASSSNPRQFIQRRGRVLRTYPGKKRAVIFDMLVEPPPDALLTDVERALVRRELRRFNEFAAAAENHGSALGTVLHLRQRLGLLDA